MSNEPQRSLFISNLPYKFKSEELHDKFSPYGSIERIDIPNYHGPLKAIAFIHYYEVEDAIAAMNGLNGESFQGHPMTIQYSTKEIPERKPIKRKPKRFQRDRDPPRNYRKDRNAPLNPSLQYIQGPQLSQMVDPYSNIPMQMPQTMMVMNVPQTIPMTAMPIQMMPVQQPIIQQMPMTMPMQMMPVQQQNAYQTQPRRNRPRDRRGFDDDKSSRHRY
ncbi:hypothetical protein TRFO_08333 [Tritrichomonas foetus]|uniref:RRM domain-containing protein n=1 Tax=Tritrichomonas foetus TaxID=1144522 RepID=A0A1J4JQ82_9EUKA|nr:hypothetical protein TRFO_08333 [Tritrichomonas foetus]|eukprot:OHS99685.1 hypothetical protein TRFO_08333 [Tritrichomonas foetus]